jgi:glutamate synthase (NADPH/NADH) large chain
MIARWACILPAIQRNDFENAQEIKAIHLNFSNSAVPGNGLASFLNDPIEVLVEGGAQDGVAKCAKGGFVGNFAWLEP